VLFAIGTRRGDLFELRYVAGIVPVLLLIAARTITALTTRRPRAAIAVGAMAVLLTVAALGDQQLNGRNPRLYDFRGALREVATRVKPRDVVIYNPIYLREVIEYYVPGVETRAAGSKAPIPRGARVFVVGSFFNKRETAGRTGAVLARLRERMRLVRELDRPQVRVWEFA
jgi:hypothetical protein